MPRRRYFRRRRRFRKKRYSGRPLLNPKYSIRDMWKSISYLKGLVNSELFKKDTSFDTTVDTTGSVTHLSDIGQGDTVSGRAGNSIFARSLYWRCLITINPTLKPTYIRLMIIRDRQQQGDTSPAIGDVLQTVSIQSPLDVSTNQGRFDILMDRVIKLDDASRQTVFTQKYLRMRSHIRYNGTASTDIQKNGLYFMAFSNEDVTDAPTVSWNARLAYHDN